MARLRVGDIEIDGSQITIGGRSVTAQSQSSVVVITNQTTTVVQQPTTPRQPRPAQPSTELATTRASTELAMPPKPVNNLEKLPGHPLTWAIAGLGLSLLSFFAQAPLVLPGIGLLVLGILKNRAQRQARRHEAALEAREQTRREAALAPVIEKIRAALGGNQPAPTVEQLSQRTSVSQPQLIRALVTMRQRGEVLEDLNTETGEWVYLLPEKHLPPALDLDQRLAVLEQQEQATTRRR